VAQDKLSCNPDKFKDFFSGTWNNDVNIAIVDTIDQSNFDDFRQGFKGDITLPVLGNFGSTWNSFNNHRAELHEGHRAKYSRRGAETWVRTKFSQAGASAYKTCIINTSGLHLWAEEIRQGGAVVYVYYKEGTNYQGPVKVRLEAKGPTKWKHDPIFLKGGSENFYVSREADKEILVIGNTSRGTPDHLVIPAVGDEPVPLPSTACSFPALRGWVGPANQGMQWWYSFSLGTNDVNAAYGKKGLPRGAPGDEKDATIKSVECKGNNFFLEETNASNGDNCKYVGTIIKEKAEVAGMQTFCSKNKGQRQFDFTWDLVSP
jgi:hypothetical protein